MAEGFNTAGNYEANKTFASGKLVPQNEQTL